MNVIGHNDERVHLEQFIRLAFLQRHRNAFSHPIVFEP